MRAELADKVHRRMAMYLGYGFDDARIVNAMRKYVAEGMTGPESEDMLCELNDIVLVWYSQLDEDAEDSRTIDAYRREHGVIRGLVMACLARALAHYDPQLQQECKPVDKTTAA